MANRATSVMGTLFTLALLGWSLPRAEAAQEVGRGKVFSVVELSFRGPHQRPTDAPTRDVEFFVVFEHADGSPRYRVHGFWDGDGQGGTEGNVFKVRFCPTKPGTWNVINVHANVAELAGQKQGCYVIAVPSERHGFWEVDQQSAGSRWFRRSDGSHQYIIGNTHYSFLSGQTVDGRPTGNDIAQDVAANAEYFKKLRFSVHGDIYPHPAEKPFLDDSGRPTDSGDDSHRPNPRWFRQRVDLAVRTAWEHDLIADLILAGPDAADSRATLRAAAGGGDPTPFLRYMAARYGSFPNVWLCLSNEYDLRKRGDFRYTPAQIARCGQIIRRFLPYPTPLSVHPGGKTLWTAEFDDLPPWHSHHIIQHKLRQLDASADVIQGVWQGRGAARPRRKPTINDELSYQGEGDRHNEGDTIEAHLGAFLGGGYGTTGLKTGFKTGHYFAGKFDPSQHTAAGHLRWLREVVDENVTFWRMTPGASVFSNLQPSFRAMSWEGHEYVLGTNRAHRNIIAELPPGRWTVTRHDVVAGQTKTLATDAMGRFVFDAPDSRAVLFHFRRSSD